MGGIGKTIGGWLGMDADLPEPPELPAPVEEVDVSGQKQYTKQRLQNKKGRQSTILSNLGTSSGGKKKTVLG
jgi:hypothetical protein